MSKPTVLHETPEVRNCLAEALSAGFWSGLKASVLSGGLYYLVSARRRSSVEARSTSEQDARTRLMSAQTHTCSQLRVH